MCGTVVVPMSTIGCETRRAPASSQSSYGSSGSAGCVRSTNSVTPWSRERTQPAHRLARVERSRIRACEQPVGDAIAVPGGEEHVRTDDTRACLAGRRCSRTDAARCALRLHPRLPCRHGRRPRRASRARLSAREATDDARPVPALTQRAQAGLQPDDEPRSDRHVRRARDPGRAPAPGSPRLDTARERRREPRREVPPAVRRSRSASSATRRPCSACSCFAARRPPVS